MGCDIHAYLDYDSFFKDDGTWYVYGLAKLHISRDYLLFAILAGVRNYDDEITPVSKPKGVPENISYQVEMDYTLWVLGEGDEVREEGCCTFEQGQRYAERRGWWREDHKRVIHPDWHSASWLDVEELKKAQEIYASTKKETPHIKFLKKGEEMPESYRISEVYAWSNTEEVTVIEEIDPGVMGKHKVLEGIISMMETLNDGENRTRLVFWFDN